MFKSNDKSREASIWLLDGVLGNKKPLTQLLNSEEFRLFLPEERAWAKRMTSHTLRGLEISDRILGKFLKKLPPLRVRNILRLAVTEIGLGNSPYAVVSEAVELVAKSRNTYPFKSLTNAVLRSVTRDEKIAQQKKTTPRLPKWLRSELVAAYGNVVTEDIEAIHFADPPVDFTPANKKGVVKLTSLLNGKLLLDHTIRLKKSSQISRLPGFKKGQWWVQDLAASIPIRLLGDIKGKKVLDLCAAPGGKSLQLCSLGANVVAADISQDRAAKLRENLERMRFHAEVRTIDALKIRGEQFDVVLLDAPCSATGTIRRNPDIPFIKNKNDVKSLEKIQGKLLLHSLDLIKPGGCLIYCTCSLLPSEGELQIEKLFSFRKDLYLNKELLFPNWIREEWVVQGLGLRLRPDFMSDEGGMDGFFITVLRKNG